MSDLQFIKQPSKLFICRLFAGFAVVIGCSVIGGWIFDIQWLIQIHPSFVPMQFNTALSFTLAGLSVFFLVVSKKYYSLIFSGCLLFISSLTLLQYLTDLNFGIDELFFEHHIMTKTSSAGRMAPNTAFCFFLTAIIVFIINLKRLLIGVALGGAIISALGLVALIGYLLNIETAYGWGHLTRMAVHTSITFIFLGMAVSLAGLCLSPVKTLYQKHWLIIFILIALLAAVLTLWQALLSREHQRISDAVDDRLVQFVDTFLLDVSGQIQALQRMGDRWKDRQGTPYEEWFNDATRYVEDFGIYQRIDKGDKQLNIEWSTQTGKVTNGSPVFSDLLIASDIRHSQQVSISKSYVIADKERVFYAIVPLYLKQEFDGIILGIVSVEKLFSRINNDNRLASDFQLTVYENDKIIYGQSSQDPLLLSFQARSHFNFEGLSWKVSLMPTISFVEQKLTILPSLVLLSGALSIGAILLFYFLYQKDKEKSQSLLLEVNQHQATKLALLRSKDNLQSIMDSTQEGILVANQAGKIVLVNPAMLSMTEYSEDELLSMSIEQLLVVDDRAQPLSYEDKSSLLTEKKTSKISAVYSGNPSVQVEDEFLLSKKGIKIPVQYFCNALLKQRGDIDGVVITIQDITQRKATESAILRYTIDLERSNKELEMFAYAASHDLKAPLRGITQLAGWVVEESEGLLSEQAEEYLKIMTNRIKRLDKLLDDLLTFASAGEKHGGFVTLNLQVLIDDIFEMIAPREKFQLTLALKTTSMRTLATPLQLIFRNLLENAIKHHDKKSGHITIKEESVAEGYCFSVIDDGSGISDEHLETIFQLFQTLKPRDEVEGSGLGLALVKKILDSYGGTINVSQAQPRGMIFQFTWPSEAALERIVNEYL